jgi:hypothetical protein
MSFKNWQARQAGREVKTYLQPTLDDEGYYRKPITEMVLDKTGKTNGQRRVVDWIPVAYFLDNTTPTVLRGLIGAGHGMRDMTDDEVDDETLWSWVCRNPISYATYHAVAEEGEPWPDLPKAAEPIILATDNAPSVVKTREDYAAEIRATVASAPKKVETKEDVEAAGGIKNKLSELRLEADKVGKAIYQPLHAAYSKAQKAWAPMVAEAKAAEDGIDRVIRVWYESERTRLAHAAAMAAQAKIDQEAANERAADRAIARGEPEPEPEIEEIVVPSTVVEPVKADYGSRTVKPEPKVFVTIEDEAKVAAFFRGNPELVAVLQKLAEREVKLGHDVPGTSKREGFA